jgi:AmmeMemoRadiSam system protein B
MVSAVMIKEPHVHGRFYEAEPGLLVNQIQGFLKGIPDDPWVKRVGVLMVPHAGLVYSGEVAACGFHAVSRQPYQTILLLGPTHYYDFPGVAIWPKGGLRTPLGVVPVDEDFSRRLMTCCPLVCDRPHIFDRDHVLEVQLPFIQIVFPHTKIVPMIMNRAISFSDLEQLVASMIDIVGERQDVLLIISSDLSHFHTEQQAHKIDTIGLEAVQRMDVDRLWQEHQQGAMEIDGFKEVITSLLYAQQRGFQQVALLKYATSGDVSGDHQRVVGYAALIIHQ